MVNKTMIKLEIVVNGKTMSDIEIGLQEIKKKIQEGYGSGMDSNNDGDYHFTLRRIEKN